MSTLSQLIEIAEKAIELQGFETDRKLSRRALEEAYEAWKEENDVVHIMRDTHGWSEMMVATKSEYQQFEEAKRVEGNAKRRLQSAIKRYQVATAA
ncbi:hypothetical protein [Brucella pituitosa]|uniref:hypothetical protein n=1 Tax=Brucella pituitosa TaxID=571256 RepID=UPI0009A1DD89|nr:hypothetical protein [Brucella pituitosa]